MSGSGCPPGIQQQGARGGLVANRMTKFGPGVKPPAPKKSTPQSAPPRGPPPYSARAIGVAQPITNAADQPKSTSAATRTVTSLPTESTINILLVGETGVGKTTFINGFPMYLQYNSLEEAARVPVRDLFQIPMQFEDIDPQTYDSERIAIGDEQDINECYGTTGDSVTQDPVVYSFKIANLSINFIDTPGVGDTSGVEKDKENVLKILKCLTHFHHLNAICLLLRPQTTRLEARFRYCLTEILRNLHESARRNIVICFANAKAVNYKPGETLSLLKHFMSVDETLKQIDISKQTVYFLENEPVRLLAKLKHAGKLSVEERGSCAEMWGKTSEQIHAMFDHIIKLPVHLVIGMTSINEARRVIAIATELLLDITKCIMQNVSAIDTQMEKIKKRKLTIESEPEKHAYDLQDQLYEEDYEMTVTKLRHPMTVCASTACSQFIKGKFVFNQICDEKCNWAPSLRLCIAMDRRGRCKKCKCHFSEHRWQTSKTEVNVKRSVNPDVLKQILNKDMALNVLQGHLKRLEVRRDKFIAEKSEILEACAKLSTFLQQNALLKSDKTNDLLFFLSQRRTTAAEIADTSDPESAAALSELEQIELGYKKKLNEVRQLKVTYTAADVRSLIDRLFALPMKGEELKNAIGVVESSRAEAVSASWSIKTRFINRMSTVFQTAFGARN